MLGLDALRSERVRRRRAVPVRAAAAAAAGAGRRRLDDGLGAGAARTPSRRRDGARLGRGGVLLLRLAQAAANRAESQGSKGIGGRRDASITGVPLRFGQAVGMKQNDRDGKEGGETPLGTDANNAKQHVSVIASN